MTLSQIMICCHCGLPIEFEDRDRVYTHTERNWGSKIIIHPDFNNGFWCDRSMTTHAEPIQQEVVS